MVRQGIIRRIWNERKHLPIKSVTKRLLNIMLNINSLITIAHFNFVYQVSRLYIYLFFLTQRNLRYTRLWILINQDRKKNGIIDMINVFSSFNKIIVKQRMVKENEEWAQTYNKLLLEEFSTCSSSPIIKNSIHWLSFWKR